jgi:hypothetical protein
MKLSEKRRQAIFAAVYDEIMNLRLWVRERTGYNSTIDSEIAQAGTRAGEAAIKAAEGK